MLIFLQSVWKDQYSKHNAAVKAVVPASQLLVYRVGEGWERLCNFLEVEVPAVPFPHENKAGRGVTEVRRGLVTLGLSVSLSLMAGWLLLDKSLRPSMK